MKKIFYIFFAAAGLCLALCGCAKSVDYYSYISELRTGIYVYEEDGLSLKIYYSQKESPYVADGIKSEMNAVCEVFLTCTNTPAEAEVNVDGKGGEMNYRAVEKSFYLSFPAEDAKKDKLNIKLVIDGKEKQFEADSVLYDGVIDARTALDCAMEYDRGTFDNLTDGSHFDGEIYIRLLFDNGCFYYVGVCDKQGDISAYLIDGENGRIIAERKAG